MHSSRPRILKPASAPRRLSAALDFIGGIGVIRISLIALALTLASCASVSESSYEPSALTLAEAETGFAKSMADRDFEAFGSYIDEQAVFINGGKPLRGKQEILDHWQAFFVEVEAPFVWKPVIAEVSAANGLGYTEGPVQLANGSTIATFYSTWQLKSDGKWKVVFDNGYDTCECREPQ
jgi:ketosteroid isomerase-like protein